MNIKYAKELQTRYFFFLFVKEKKGGGDGGKICIYMVILKINDSLRHIFVSHSFATEHI